MTNALQQAYAGSGDAPLITLEFLHSGLDGGALRLVQAHYDVTATLETGHQVVFAKSGISVKLPDRSTEGRQELDIRVDNTSNYVWVQLSKVITATRQNVEPVLCIYRPYLEDDLTAPAGAPYRLTVKSSSVNRATASIRATYTPIPDISYPRFRYYPTQYPGLKYR